MLVLCELFDWSANRPRPRLFVRHAGFAEQGDEHDDRNDETEDDADAGRANIIDPLRDVAIEIEHPTGNAAA